LGVDFFTLSEAGPHEVAGPWSFYIRGGRLEAARARLEAGPPQLVAGTPAGALVTGADMSYGMNAPSSLRLTASQASDFISGTRTAATSRMATPTT
jgi:hypothetical protein